MSVLRIVTIFDNDAAILRQPARKVKRFGPELERLANDMIETMRDAGGVGLAAPQVGVPLRLFVASLPPEEDDPNAGRVYILVNPKLVKASITEVQGEEGCLSIPGIYGDVWRAEEIVVKAQDLRGQEQRFRVKGYLARIFQHEMDHLDGILFIDRVEDPTSLRTYVRKGEEVVAEPAHLDPKYFRPLKVGV